MASKVLVTGGSGFLGKSVLSHLLNHSEDEIYTLSRSRFDYPKHIQCNLLDYKELRGIIEDLQPQKVYHLSGNALAKPNEDNPSEILYDNIVGTNNLLDLLPRGCRVVFSSSATVYGQFSKDRPKTWDSRPHPISIYATTKLACENLIHVYNHQGRIKGTSVRIPALVGRNPTHGVLKDIIRKLESDSPTLDLIGNAPGTIKPFCHIDDVAKILFNICEDKYELGETVLIGRKDSISVLTIANIVMRYLKKKEITWSGQTWAGDNLAIYIEPDIRPPISSEEAIEKTITEYARKNGLLS